MKSEGLQCATVGDCDRRLCRVGSHVVCNNHKCTCARGSYIGGPCSTASTCDPSGCPQIIVLSAIFKFARVSETDWSSLDICLIHVRRNFHS